MTTDAALVDGRWVQHRGGIWRWVGDRPTDKPEPAPIPIIHRPRYGRLALLRTTCHCGCLIAIHEDCPNCLVAQIRNGAAA